MVSVSADTQQHSSFCCHCYTHNKVGMQNAQIFKMDGPAAILGIYLFRHFLGAASLPSSMYYLLLQICSQQNKSPVPSSTESNPLPHRRAFISHKSANPPIFYRIKFQV